ncbi:MAG TPA: TonB-dependent receptor [Candidatus Kapabacteria bacterium]|nr:TonB-dependent receptor [Candidatus Kapabacteria bacterium]
MKNFILLFIILIVSSLQMPAKIIEGIIKDYNEEFISGASIRIEGTLLGAISKVNGSYVIKNIPDDSKKISLIVSMIGYKTLLLDINLDSNIVHKDIYIEIQPLQIEEVVVSANKKVQQVQEVPISMSVIDSRGIMDRGITELDEALLYVPGVEVNQDNINIRGTSGFSFGIGSRIALLLDGFPMLAGDNNDAKFDAFPMMSINRIEVVKGAGSALYGTSALGGVVNLITEEPKENAAININAFSGIYTKPRYEQWAWNSKNNLYSGINTSYSKKFTAFDLIASAQYIKDDSYREYDDGIRASAFAKMNYAVSDFSKISLLLNYAGSDAADWVYWNGLDSATKPPSNTNKDIRIKSNKLSLFGSFNQIIDDYNFMLIKAGAFVTDFRNSYDEKNLEYRQSNAINFNTEIQINSEISKSHNLTYGANINIISVDSKIYGNRIQNMYSGYFQWEMSGIDNLITTFGARFDHEEAEGVQNNTEISPKMGLSYKLSKLFNLRASVGRGFRAPAVAERYSTVAYQGFDVLPNLKLKPEISWSYEIGFNYETKIYDNPIYLDVSIFRNDLNNLIEATFANANSANIQFQNIKEARIQGIELSVKSFLFGFLGLESSITLMDPKDITLNQTLNYRSELLWYNRILVPLGDIELQCDYRFKKKSENIDKQLGLIINDINARVDMHVIDARIIYKLSKLINSETKIIFSARNLLDYYYTEMVGNLAPTRLLMLGIEAKL